MARRTDLRKARRHPPWSGSPRLRPGSSAYPSSRGCGRGLFAAIGCLTAAQTQRYAATAAEGILVRPDEHRGGGQPDHDGPGGDMTVFPGAVMMHGRLRFCWLEGGAGLGLKALGGRKGERL